MEKTEIVELSRMESGSRDPMLPPPQSLPPGGDVEAPHPSAEVDPVPNRDQMSRLFIGLAYLLVTITFPISIFFCVVVIAEYERGVWLRLGRLQEKAVGPGIKFRIPCVDQIVVVDMRTKTINVPPQSVLSSDSVTVTVDAVIYTRVFNSLDSVLNVAYEKRATELLGQTTLRNVLGTKSLAEILAHRDAIAAQMKEVLDTATDAWGVKVERVEIKDVSLPQSMQRSMAAIAEAEREARARIIAAESEQQASIALRKAAEEIANTPAALQLRYLQTLNTISAEHSSTIVFPFPMDLLSLFANKMAA